MSTHIERTAPPAHKDARTGCIPFGVLVILMGAACVLLIPLLLVVRHPQITRRASCPGS